MYKYIILFLLIPTLCYAQHPRVYSESQHPLRHQASRINVVDTGGRFTGTNVETVLAEIGNGDALDDLFLKLDASNDPITGALQINDDLTIGNGLAGADYSITFDGDTSDATIYLDESDQWLCIEGTEGLCYDLDSTANEIAFRSKTGVTTLKFDGISQLLKDGTKIKFGNSNDAHLFFDGSDTRDKLTLGLGVGSDAKSGYFSIMGYDGMGDATREPAAFTVNPTVRIYSDDEAEALDYLDIYHDQTDSNIVTGVGDLNLVPASGTVEIDDTLKINDTGDLAGSPVAGTFEFDNNRMYLTNVAIQRVIDRSSDVVTSTTTVANTVVESTLHTTVLAANALKAGNHVHVEALGLITNATAADDITFNLYIGSTLIETFNPAIGNVTDEDWHAEIELTVRSVGGSGSIAVHGHTEIGSSEDVSNTIQTIDTTAAEDLTIKVQWDNAKAGNTISIYQGAAHWSY